MRDGAKAASVTIAGPTAGDTLTVNYPKAEMAMTGAPLHLSRIACGFDSIVDLSSKDRAVKLVELLKTVPAREDLAATLLDFGFKDEPPAPKIDAALAKAGKTFDPALSLMNHAKAMTEAGTSLNVVDWLWRQIEHRGWDETAKKLEKERAELRGSWAEVAGEAFGDKKVQDWTPQGWTPDLAEASAEGMKAVLESARATLEAAVGQAAVDQSVLSDLRADAGKLADLKAAEEAAREKKLDAEVAVVNAEAALKPAQRAFDELPPVKQAKGLECPHCNGQVHYHCGTDGERLDKAEAISDDVLRKRRLDRADTEGKLSNAKDTLNLAKAAFNTALRAFDDAQRAVAQAEAAKKRLAEMETSTDGKAATADQVDGARQAVTAAEARLDLHQRKARADTLARRIAGMTNIIGLLGSDGCRKAKLAKVLDIFNDQRLRGLCDAAGWAPVRIENDVALTVTYGQRPYAALSGHGPQISSDQFRTRVILQIAFAVLAGDPLVIIDAADILDQKGRNGLFTMLKEVGMAAIVCMTFSMKALKDRKIPDLEAAKLGQSYWVADGVAKPLAEAITAAPPAKKAA
ncbi:hypothetical protein ABMY26_00510 (plasmid) [Azospirillum sp. HJ39]|uniref:hypothetical protein n=1 Tax=Azospirillum sp. HJ39 TaxID=3159496 RepID=UPI00355721CF